MSLKRMSLKRMLSISLVLVFLGTVVFAAPVASQEAGRKLEYIPLYKYRDNPEEALKLLKSNLADLDIGEDRVTVTILPLQPKKIAAQGTPDAIEIVKTLMKSIDPSPKAPPKPPDKPQDVIKSFNVRYLAPNDLWIKLDEVMNNFLDFKRFDTGADNNVVFARGDGSQNRINFYIPNYEMVEKTFFERKQGYSGYKVFYRATTAENKFMETILEFLLTIDHPIGDKRYEIIQVYYIQVAAIITQLKAAGYTAIDTGSAIDANSLKAIQSGISPVIYSSPQITTETTSISTQFSSRSEGRIGGNQFKILEYKEPTATSDINNIIVYGSQEEIDGIRSFVEMMDVPAKQILIEAQIIEINIDDLSDIGLRQMSGNDDLIESTSKPAFPGETASSSQEETAVILTYDDSGVSAGDFQASIAALVLEGKATIKARPKVTTVDGRQAIITIVRQVPVVQETIINQNQSRFDISFVPVGITLNIKPRIGRGNSEISMQVNAVVSNVETINNVVTGLNIQAPELNTREVSTIVRVPNHQPLILGGLISTQTEERTYKVPILGDIPLLGKLFRRTKSKQDRTEIIIVITPHIAEEIGDRIHQDINEYQIDSPMLIPKDSSYLDELDNQVTPSTYFIKFADIVGVDPVSHEPISFHGEPPAIGSLNDPVFMTVKRIVDKHNMVKKLNLPSDIVFPDDYPYEHSHYEKTIAAEAFLVNYIIQLNDLRLENLIVGRVIILPTQSVNVNEKTGGKSKWPGDKIDPTINKDLVYLRIWENIRKHHEEKEKHEEKESD